MKASLDEFPILRTFDEDSLVGIFGKYGVEGSEGKKALSEVWDSLFGLIINPDVDMASYVMTRLFRSHAFAIQIGEKIAQGDAEVFKLNFGFFLHETERLQDFIKAAWATYPALNLYIKEDEIIGWESYDPADEVNRFSDPTTYLSQPGKRSLIHRLKQISSPKELDKIFNKHFIAEALHMLLLKRAEAPKYMFLRLLMGHSEAIQATSNGVLDKLAERLQINWSERETIQKGLRRLVSYHPSVGRMFQSFKTVFA